MFISSASDLYVHLTFWVSLFSWIFSVAFWLWPTELRTIIMGGNNIVKPCVFAFIYLQLVAWALALFVYIFYAQVG